MKPILLLLCLVGCSTTATPRTSTLPSVQHFIDYMNKKYPPGVPIPQKGCMIVKPAYENDTCIGDCIEDCPEPKEGE